MHKSGASGSLFVYGSLMQPDLRRRLLGREVAAQPAYLRDFERRRGRYFYVERKPGTVVEGHILSPLTADELCALDRYEEAPRLYTRRRLTVHERDGRARRAWVYLPTRLLLDRTVA